MSDAFEDFVNHHLPLGSRRRPSRPFKYVGRVPPINSDSYPPALLPSNVLHNYWPVMAIVACLVLLNLFIWMEKVTSDRQIQALQATTAAQEARIAQLQAELIAPL